MITYIIKQTKRGGYVCYRQDRPKLMNYGYTPDTALQNYKNRRETSQLGDSTFNYKRYYADGRLLEVIIPLITMMSICAMVYLVGTIVYDAIL